MKTRACAKGFLVLAAVGLSGCPSSATREREIEATRGRTLPPARDSGSVDAIFRAPPVDPRIDLAIVTSPTLALVQDAAVQRNPNLKVALERWAAYLERAPQRLAPPSPVFRYEYLSMFKMMSWGVDLGVPFPTKLATDARAALADADAMGADYRATENALRLQAANAYAALSLARRQVEIVDENLALLVRFVETAETKYKAGTATLPDVLRVETERESLLAEREVLAKNVEVAASSLNVLLDRTPDEPIGTLAPLEEPREPGSLPVLYETALARRPELEGVRARTESSSTMVSRANQEWVPDLELGAAYVRDFGGQHNFGSITAGVTLPWVFGSAVSAKVREAEAQLRGSEAEARSTRNMVLDEVKASFARLEAVTARYRRLQKEVIPRIRRNLEASEAAYVAGTVDFLTLIDTQRTLLAALLEEQAALTECVTRRAELVKATGGSPP